LEEAALPAAAAEAEVVATAASSLITALLDHPAHQDSLEPQERMDSPVKPARTEKPPKEPSPASPVDASPALLDPLDHPDQMDHPDPVETTDNPAAPEPQETADKPDHQDQLEMPDHQDLQDSPVPQETLEPQEPVAVEPQDPRDHPDQQDPLANPEPQDKAPNLAHPDHQDQLDHPDSPELPEATDSQEDQEAQEFPDPMPPTAHAHQGQEMPPLPVDRLLKEVPAAVLVELVAPAERPEATSSALSRRLKRLSSSNDNTRAEPLFGVEDASPTFLHFFQCPPPLSMCNFNETAAVFAIVYLFFFGIQKNRKE
jgi:hypothetical protein